MAKGGHSRNHPRIENSGKSLYLEKVFDKIFFGHKQDLN